MVLDPYQYRKSVHVNLRKEAYIQLRQKLFPKDISIQEFFDRITEEFVKDSRFSLNSIIDHLVVEKTKESMEKSKFKERKRINHKLSDLDVNTLYNLINEEVGRKDREPEKEQEDERNDR